LTAVGTVGLAVVTVWLANRKPKLHLALAVGLARGGEMFVIRIVNDGVTSPVFHKCELLAKQFTFGRLDVPIQTMTLNGISFGMGAYRLTSGDELQAWCRMDDLAVPASTALPPDLNREQVEAAARSFVIICATTTGESFSAPLPDDVQHILAGRINLTRRLSKDDGETGNP
jgi:hypothetical protein